MSDQHIQLRREADNRVHKNRSALADWCGRVSASVERSVERIQFEESKEWAFEDGRLRHKTGRFFTIAGLEWRTEDGKCIHQPVIDQPEIGLLGYMMRRTGSGEKQILAFAKAEPGNVGTVQIAPSVQATQSNYERVHGGRPQDLMRFFSSHSTSRVISNSLQTEQTSRFLGKANRNMVIEIPRGTDAVSRFPVRWIGIEEFLLAAGEDYRLNTDARSVLVSCDWEALSPLGSVFADRAFGNDLRRALRLSYGASDEQADHPFSDLTDWHERRKRAASRRRRMLPLNALPGWRSEPDRIIDTAGERFEVIQIRVSYPDRECGEWDQPIVSGPGPGRVVLACQRRRGNLHFLVKTESGPGSRDGADICASVELPPERIPDSLDRSDEAILNVIDDSRYSMRIAAARMSDEGGRFHDDRSSYEIWKLDGAVSVPLDRHRYRWVTLGQLLRFVRSGLTVTNEARSALSLLLPFI